MGLAPQDQVVCQAQVTAADLAQGLVKLVTAPGVVGLAHGHLRRAADAGARYYAVLMATALGWGCCPWSDV
jgi:hypothetical protein